MFFTGDIAVPYKDAVVLKDFPTTLLESFWVGNLEGSLIDFSGREMQSNGVFNDLSAIKELLYTLPFKAFVLANNHLLDVDDYIATAQNIKDLRVQHVGAGVNLSEASKYLDVTDIDGTTYRILAFGWDCIECVYATKHRQGVNPYIKRNVKQSVQKALSQDVKVVCFFHWDYELELYPQPYDRKLAHELIDMGVYAVIGCHSHRTQQVEFYKSRPIVYGLGNFLFRQGYYFNGKLKYPAFSNKEWAVELIDDAIRLHRFEYVYTEGSTSAHVLKYIGSETLSESSASTCRAEYENLDDKSYEEFFIRNRVQRKLLPIFRSNESVISYRLKTLWVKLRGHLLNILSSLHIKSSDRSLKK